MSSFLRGISDWWNGPSPSGEGKPPPAGDQQLGGGFFNYSAEEAVKKFSALEALSSNLTPEYGSPHDYCQKAISVFTNAIKMEAFYLKDGIVREQWELDKKNSQGTFRKVEDAKKKSAIALSHVLKAEQRNAPVIAPYPIEKVVELFRVFIAYWNTL